MTTRIAWVTLACLSVGLRSAPIRLLYSVGLSDGSKNSDGVVFSVAVGRPGQNLAPLSEVRWDRREWLDREVDLSAWRGEEILLRFTTAPGETTTDDWACWGAPRIVEGEDKVLLDFTKAKIWRTGTIVDGEEVSPMRQDETGATFLSGTRSCGGVPRPGFFAHPPWLGDAQGGSAFAEFKIRVGAEPVPPARRPPMPAARTDRVAFPSGVAPCFRTASPIRIDGDLSDWPPLVARAALTVREKEQMSIEVASYKPGWKAGWRGPGDLSADVYLAWDDRYLYLAEIRRDDVLQFMDTTSPDFSRSDSLCIGISAKPGAAVLAEEDFILAVNPDGEMDRPMIKTPSYGRRPRTGRRTDGVQVSPAFYNDGYILELRIPFALMNVEPRAGLNLGFQLVLTDSDTPMDRHYEMLWRPKAASDYRRNPSTFGRITLCRDTFAWLNLERKHYAIGESPEPVVGVFPSSRDGAVTVTAQIAHLESGSNSTLGPSRFRHGDAIPFPPLGKGGETTCSYTLTSRRDEMTGRWKLSVFKDPGERNLDRLGQPEQPGLLPSLRDARGRTRLFREGEAYVFEYADDVGTLRYSCRPSPGFDIQVSYAGTPLFRSEPDRTGPIVRRDGGNIPLQEYPGDLTDVSSDGNSLSYRYRLSDGSGVTFRLALRGRTLVADVRSPRAIFSEFRGPLYGMSGELVPIPYLEPRLRPLTVGDCFVSSYPDWTRTGASSLRRFGSTAYGELTDGSRNPLRERVYLTVSPDLLEVLPNLPNPKSSLHDLLSTKVVFDWWTWPGTFEGGARYLRALKGYGLDEVAVIYHVWQKHGYDNGLPEHVPAMESMGGDAGMKTLAGTARELGYLFSLHENYIDYYPNYPQYTEDAVALDSRGRKVNAWYMPSTGIQSYRLKPSWIERYVRDQAPKANALYGTSAAYLDVQTVNFPWQIDYEAGIEGAGQFLHAYKKLSWLFDYMREVHGGPLFGEGNMHAVWAGRADGCEAQIGGRGGEIHPVLVDFDLLKVHPLAVNHGMGYYSRWHRLRHGKLTDREMDKYRAQELAYGHAGFLNTGMFAELTQVLREYYLVQPIQERYVPARPVSISYLFDKQWVSSQIACRTKAGRRVHVAYDNGLELWINDGRPGWIVGDRKLPPYGFVASGAGVEAWTAWVGEGLVADYAETEPRIFADPRTYETVYVDNTAPRHDVKLLPASVTPGAPRDFHITYHWEVNEGFDKDYVIFVHFITADGRIGWQQDHSPETATSAWQAGKRYDDGPYTVEVPATIPPGDYGVGVGLFRPGDGRVRLAGDGHGENRYVVGTIRVGTAKDSISFLPPDPRPTNHRPGRNPAGTMADFGKLASDFAVRIDRLDNELLVMPIPHGRAGTILLRMERLLSGRPWRGFGVVALDARRQPIRGAVPVTRTEDGIRFRTSLPDAWYYRIGPR